MAVITFSGRTHLIFGGILWILLAISGLWVNPITTLVGTILPDADHKRSMAGRLLPLHWFWRHRGFTHTIWALLIFVGLTYWAFGKFTAMGMLVGYASHLLLDACTPMGVGWIRGRKFRK